MAVKDFECQIARGQIGRYVGGEALSPEALRQLGLHVAECEDCRDHLEQRRVALQSMVNKGASSSEPAEPPYKPGAAARKLASKAVVTPAAMALMDQIRRKTGEGLPLEDKRPSLDTAPVAAPAPSKNLMPLLGKPAMYSIALAAVLIAMTYLSKNPTIFFGPKLGASKKALPSTETAANSEAQKQPDAKPTEPKQPETKPAEANVPQNSTAATSATAPPASNATTNNAAVAATAAHDSVGHEPVGHGPLPQTTPPATPAPADKAASEPSNAVNDAKAEAKPDAPAATAPKETPKAENPAPTTAAVKKPVAPALKSKAAKSKVVLSKHGVKKVGHRLARRRHRARAGVGKIRVYAPGK